MVTLVNKFTVTGDPADFERIWRSSSEFIRTQPGFLGFRLVRSLHDRSVYVNIAEWSDERAHQQVVASAAFRRHIEDLAAVATPEPLLCEVVIEHA